MESTADAQVNNDLAHNELEVAADEWSPYTGNNIARHYVRLSCICELDAQFSRRYPSAIPLMLMEFLMPDEKRRVGPARGSRLLFGRVPRTREDTPPETQVMLQNRRVENQRRRQEFAKRLGHYLSVRGIKNIDVARALADRLVQPVSHTSISRYLNTREFPNEARFMALCEFLGVRPEDLVPDINSNPKAGPPSFEVKHIEGGKLFLRVNQVVEWDVAVKVMALLKEGNR